MNYSDISNGDFNPSILYACKNKRMEKGLLHTHDYIELMFVLSGNGQYQINGNTYSVKTGDLLCMNPQDAHAHICSPNQPLVLFAVGFEDIHLKNMKKNYFYFPDANPVLHISTDLKAKIMQLCYTMLEEEGKPFPGRYFMMRSYLTQMLVFIMREITNKTMPDSNRDFMSSQKSYVVRTILEYMHEHYNERVSLDEIAGNMYLSPIYISKIFKEETGDSPINHLIQIRLEKAKDLICNNPSMTIKTIAKSVGYEDAYYFSKLFKKHHGVAPSKYNQSF